MKGPKRPSSILAISVTRYLDSGQIIAEVSWSDGSSTTGDPDNAHMRALFARGIANGLTVQRYSAGWLPE